MTTTPSSPTLTRAWKRKMQAKPRTRAEKRKDIVGLEKKFLSSVLHGFDYDDLRRDTRFLSIGRVIARYPGDTWRRFVDRRHRALWRVLETLDLSQRVGERKRTIIAEDGNPDYYADNLGALRELERRSSDLAWLEHELAAAGVLAAAGGKTYLRQVYRFLDMELYDDEMKALEGKLNITREAKK